MKTLHFDARFIRLDHHDGISRFSVELVKALAQKIRVVALIFDLRQLEHLPEGVEYLVVNNPQSAREILLPRKLNKLGASHVFSPMQLMGSWGRRYKLILTLHDLIYYTHRKPPQDLSLLVRGIWRAYHLSYLPQKLLLNRADAIATVSETTKKLMQRKGLTRKPIGVIYNAPEKITSGKRAMPEKRTLLYIGSFMPYKNVETLIRAAGLLPKYELLLLSKITPKRREALADLAGQVGANVKFLNGVSDHEYQKLLRSAFALVSASKDEGFGIPLVEAMQLGTPVVVSNLEIFHEVAGSAGSYFDPTEPKGLEYQLGKLSEADNWLKVSELSVAQAQKYNWEDSAEVLLTMFQELDR